MTAQGLAAWRWFLPSPAPCEPDSTPIKAIGPFASTVIRRRSQLGTFGFANNF